MRTKLVAAGRASGERVWPFPLDEDYDSDLDSKSRTSCSAPPKARATTSSPRASSAASCPTEIAVDSHRPGCGNRSGGLAHVPTDFTGFGVRYTLELLLASQGAPRA